MNKHSKITTGAARAWRCWRAARTRSAAVLRTVGRVTGRQQLLRHDLRFQPVGALRPHRARRRQQPARPGATASPRRGQHAVPGPDADREPGRYGAASRCATRCGAGVDRVSRGSRASPPTGGVAGRSLTNEVATGGGHRDVQLHGIAAGHLHLPERHPAGARGRDGPGRRADRAADGLRGGYDAAHPNRRAYGSATPAPTTASTSSSQTEMDRARTKPIDAIQQAGADATVIRRPHNPPDASAAKVDPASFKATLWFLNGRNGPDTMLKRSVDWMPLQPYNALARMHPGERVLMRLIGGWPRPASVPPSRQQCLADRARRPVLESTPGARARRYPDFLGIGAGTRGEERNAAGPVDLEFHDPDRARQHVRRASSPGPARA